MAEPTIGNWTESQLSRYIREYNLRHLPDHIPGLTVDDLVVMGSLNVKGPSTFNRKLFTVGGTGAPFTNSWVNNLAGYAPAAYWKDDAGLVWVEGTIKSGTLGVAAWVFPPGFRPDQSRIFPAFSNANLGLVQITSGGQVQPLAVGSASNASYTLDGIVFRTGKT